MEQPFTFANREGFQLFGMLYAPDSPPARRVGIVVSVNAIKYRLGTFRLHTLLARKLCALGYYVFTFDPAGIGDSEGHFDFKLLSEHYYDIQVGKYNADLTDACNEFMSRCRLDTLLLCGLCGGAVSVLMASADDPRVAGLILLNIPVLMEDLERKGEIDHSAKITSSGAAKTLLAGKFGRLGELDFWRRLVLFQVDLAEEGRLVRKAMAVIVGKGWRALTGNSKPLFDPAIPVSKHQLFNMYFQRSFFRAMETKKRLLFVFAELDPWTAIFASEFQAAVLLPGGAFEQHCSIDVVATANHIFSGRESQGMLEQRITGWLSRWYPVEGVRADA